MHLRQELQDESFINFFLIYCYYHLVILFLIVCMNTTAFFLKYLKRVWWMIVFILGFLVILLNKQYIEDVEDRKVRAFDAAISAQVQIEQLLENLSSSSQSFTTQYSNLIQHAYTEKESAEELNSIVKHVFPGVKYLVLTDKNGVARFGGVEQNNVQLCVNDILRFMKGLDHEAYVHQQRNKVHFDVVNLWKSNDKEGSLSIAFDIALITEIMNFYQPIDYHLILVDKFKPKKIEIILKAGQFSYKKELLTDLEYKEAVFKIPVLNTRWMLVVVQKEESFWLYKYRNIYQILAITILFLIVILVGLLRLSRETARTHALIQKEHKNKQKDKDMLQSLVQGTSGATGDAFFFSLVKELSNFMNVDYAFIALKQKNTESSYTTLAHWSKDHYKAEEEIMVLNMIFENDSFRYVKENFEKEFGRLTIKGLFKVSGFLASRLFNNKGEEIAVLIVLSPNALLLNDSKLAVMKIFASRAEAEIDRKNTENDLIEEKERAHSSLKSIGDGVITTDEFACIDFMNPVAERLTGWEEGLAKGLILGSVFHLEDEETGNVIPDPALHCIEERRMISPKTENVLVAKNSSRYSIKGSASPMYGISGDCVGAVIVFSDVTESRKMQRKIAFQASHDALTGLVNRTEFERRLEASFKSSKEFGHKHVLLYLDLDQFKVVNDTAGHIAGDELLIQVAKLLLEQLRTRDTLGRLGGDEFSVLLEHCPISEARARAQTLIDAIREFSFIWEEKTYHIGVSIGLVPINQDSLSTVQILTQADLACYTAKDKGRGQAHVFTEGDAEVATRHRELLRAADLNEAIEQHRFELLYQPIIALNDDDKMHGEVLLRLLDEHGDYILPGAFIPAAERYGIMDKIDRWVLSKIFGDYRHIFEKNPNLLLCINLSGNSLSSGSLLPFILGLFEGSAIKPKQICFEITETAAINSLVQLNELINVLKVKGCHFALDDFGSGLSSFNYLKTMKVDYLKIDGYFVKDLCVDEVDRAMVKSINEMGHILGLKTIAECADNAQVVDLLKEMGVDYAQGYYLGELVPMSSL